MKKAGLIIILALIFMLSISSSADSLKWPEVFEGDNEFTKMKTTAYCLHGVTATGGTTRPGIAACDPHIGEIAIIYTLDGEYLGSFEVTDTGGTDAIHKGYVIDVWFDTYEECKEWMIRTQGKCYCKFVKGKGRTKWKI